MLTAIVLICAVGAECNQETAQSVLRVPERFAAPASCFMHGQAYLAETAIGQDMAADQRAVVLCVRP